MATHESIVRTLRTPSRRLYESSVCLSSSLKAHKEAGQDGGDGGDQTPTLAALARHHRLGQLLRVTAALIVVLEKLFRRLEERPSNAAKDAFPELFSAIDTETRAILKVSGDFRVAKEDRHRMEDSINLVRDSLQVVLDALRAAHDSRHQSPGRRPDNRMMDTVEGLGVDWALVHSLVHDLPTRYPLDYSQIEKN